MRPSIRHAGIIVAVLACLCAPHSGRAQTVRGRLIDENTAAPLAGGFIRLVDPAGRRVAEMLTGDAGVYQLRAPSAGSYRLRVERLGYKTYESAVFTLDSTLVRDLRIPHIAIELPSITARVDSKCTSSDAAAAAVSTLWEEVRKVVSITAWTAEHGDVLFQMRTVRQQLNPANLRVISETREMMTNRMSGSPYVARAQDSLLVKGFIQKNEDGRLNYYGPDGAMILSDEFRRTHCFHGVIDRGHRGQVGLAFEPIGAIDASDIRGVLWLDEKTFELRNIVYSYNRIPVNAPKSAAGGEVTFTHLDTGQWIVSAWTILAPLMSNEGARVILDNPAAKPDAAKHAVFVGLTKTVQSVMSAYAGDTLIYKAEETDK
jgi:hypothetical protein